MAYRSKNLISHFWCCAGLLTSLHAIPLCALTLTEYRLPSAKPSPGVTYHHQNTKKCVAASFENVAAVHGTTLYDRDILRIISNWAQLKQTIFGRSIGLLESCG